MKFKVVLEKGEGDVFTVTVPELPGCISQGKNKEEALKNIKEAIELHLSNINKHVREVTVTI